MAEETQMNPDRVNLARDILTKAGFTNGELAFLLPNGKPEIYLGPENRQQRAERMIASYKDGLTLEQIAQQYGISRERVRQIMAKRGITQQDGGRWALVEQKRQKRKAEKNAASKAYQDGIRAKEYGCTADEFYLINGCWTIAQGTPAWSYRDQRRNARLRGIEFSLTFKEWMEIWMSSGHFHERGRAKGQYVMSRKGDQGGYDLGNVFIQLASDNIKEVRDRERQQREAA